jgi:hypothetical protein
MKTFKDNADRLWSVGINVNAVKRCRAVVDVDLYGLVGDGFDGLARLLGDPCKLVDVLYVLCKAEADSRGLTDEDFGAGMAGDAIQHATDAFVGSLVEFFPDPKVRAALKAVIEKGRMVRARVIEHLDRQVEAFDPDRAASELIASSGSSRASSGSTPAPSPSASST